MTARRLSVATLGGLSIVLAACAGATPAADTGAPSPAAGESRLIEDLRILSADDMQGSVHQLLHSIFQDNI